ncbi:uncharacterized protein CEXT_274661 [Caerostris extrusa]|uniref:Uncharacterized protein n=1 Tax=Caerostris extrusa TaxID=172846 RepID=A0AAV4REI1_CAEEX|nr:uncharacterized protein CEXT_274661 [Caerostris extrusa]
MKHNKKKNIPRIKKRKKKPCREEKALSRWQKPFDTDIDIFHTEPWQELSFSPARPQQSEQCHSIAGRRPRGKLPADGTESTASPHNVPIKETLHSPPPFQTILSHETHFRVQFLRKRAKHCTQETTCDRFKSAMFLKITMCVWFIGWTFTTSGNVVESSLLDGPTVYLTVSSVPSQTGKARLLEMNWDNLPQRADIRLYLHDSDPSLPDSTPLLTIRPNSSKGYHRTSLQFPEQVFSSSNLSSACLGYWITCRLDDREVASSCLRARPHWMHESRDTSETSPSWTSFFPGHTTPGATPPSTPKRTRSSRGTSTLRRRASGTSWCSASGTWTSEWRTSRRAGRRSSDSDHAQQLQDGRHRHGRGAAAEAVPRRHQRDSRHGLPQVRHRLPETHRNHQTSPQRTDHPAGTRTGGLHDSRALHFGAALQELWDADRRLYVGYADEGLEPEAPTSSRPSSTCGGRGPGGGPLGVPERDGVRPAHATPHLRHGPAHPTRAGALFNLYGGLRKMADQVNRQVTRWFSSDWNHCANIVATDFFLGNNIIELAIETNQNRFARGESDSDH